MDGRIDFGGIQDQDAATATDHTYPLDCLAHEPGNQLATPQFLICEAKAGFLGRVGPYKRFSREVGLDWGASGVHNFGISR